MARHEQDREDLLAEAKALVARAEIAIAGRDEPIVLGFRRDGGCSYYFSPEEAYHFNPAGELRRAFVAGLLYKAERGRLVSLRRHRTAHEVQLLRHELDDAEQAAFIARAQQQLHTLRQVLAAGSYNLLREVLPVGDAAEDQLANDQLANDQLANDQHAKDQHPVVARAQEWLAERQVVVAATPRA